MEQKQNRLRQQASLQTHNNGRLQTSQSVPPPTETYSEASRVAGISFDRSLPHSARQYSTTKEGREAYDGKVIKFVVHFSVINFNDQFIPITAERFDEGNQQSQITSQPSEIHSRSKMLMGLANIERQMSTPNILGENHSRHPSDLERNKDRSGRIVEEGNGNDDRSALLESICRFNRGSLRKVRSND